MRTKTKSKIRRKEVIRALVDEVQACRMALTEYGSERAGTLPLIYFLGKIVCFENFSKIFLDRVLEEC